MTYLKDREALKGFWAQYPTAKILFGEIIKVWRSAASRKVGTNGYWAAWPYLWWSERTKLPSSTLRWNLDLLEENDLIERTRGRHGGTRVIAFIRPTDHALKLSDGYDKHWNHLHEKHFEPKLELHNQLFNPTPEVPKSVPNPGSANHMPKSLEELLAAINSPVEPG